MKFQMISENDVTVLREARKVLKKLKKRENKLEAHVEDALNNLNYSGQKVKDYVRLIKELDVLHINVEDNNGDMSLDTQ